MFHSVEVGGYSESFELDFFKRKNTVLIHEIKVMKKKKNALKWEKVLLDLGTPCKGIFATIDINKHRQQMEKRIKEARKLELHREKSIPIY